MYWPLAAAKITPVDVVEHDLLGEQVVADVGSGGPARAWLGLWSDVPMPQHELDALADVASLKMHVSDSNSPVDSAAECGVAAGWPVG